MYKNVLCLVLGVVIGIRLTDLWDYVQWQNSNGTQAPSAGDSTKMPTLQAHTSELLISQTPVPESLHAQLYKSTRVLCWVLTAPEFHEKRAQHVKATWGQRCHKLLFMSTATDDKLGSIKLPVPEGRTHLWEKTRAALKYIYENHLNDADWFLKADDDTYVIMENLRLFLHAYDTEAPVYFGCKFNPFVRQGYMSGGAGYVLSKEALRRFMERGYGSKKLCKPNTLSEDKELGICLQNIGVIAGDSRDSLGRERFLPLAPKHLIPDSTSNWLAKYLFYKRDKSDFCCSDTAISFHYTKPHEFYIFDYFLYNLRTFGLPQTLPEKLPQRLSSNEMSQLLDKWHDELTDNIFVD